MKLYLCILLVGLVAGCSDKKAIESQNARIEEQGKKIKELIAVVEVQNSMLSNTASVLGELSTNFYQSIEAQKLMAVNYDERLRFLEYGVSNLFISGAIHATVQAKSPKPPGK